MPASDDRPTPPGDIGTHSHPDLREELASLARDVARLEREVEAVRESLNAPEPSELIDRDGDVWTRTPGGGYRCNRTWRDRDQTHPGFPREYVERHYGPLVSIK